MKPAVARGARRDIIDLTGQRFGQQVVVRWVGYHYYPSGQGQTMYLARCDCGTLRRVSGQALREGRSVGCNPCLGLRKRLVNDGRPHGVCYCGSPGKQRAGRASLESECQACNRRAARNGRHSCGRALYKTRPCACEEAK